MIFDFYNQIFRSIEFDPILITRHNELTHSTINI